MKAVLYTFLAAIFLLGLTALTSSAYAQVCVQFESGSDLTTFFNTPTSPVYTVGTGNGIGGTNAVDITPGNSNLYTYKLGILAAGVGTVYNVNAYFYNSANSGYAGLGFSTSNSNAVVSFGCTSVGLGMITHAGGGYFANNSVESDVTYDVDQLNNGNWYKVVFTATDMGSNTFDLEYQIWSANPDGSTITMITDEQMPGVTNADIGGASTIYAYFSSVQDRMTAIDNFSITNAPLPIQLSSLTAASSGGSSVTLNWKTASETNNYGFYVERSASKSSGFSAVSGLIPGHGTSVTGFSYVYTDKSAPAGTAYYRLEQVDLDNSVHYSDAVMLTTTDVAQSAPIVFALSQNYPNPFNPSTEFRFTVARTGLTTLIVYNALGQEVSRIFNGETESGEYYTARLDGSALASGVYFARLQSGTEIQMKKIVLMK